MPELPEVEILKRELEKELVGRTITGVEVRLEKLFRSADGLAAERIVGQRIKAIGRYGKHLIFDLTDELTMIVHLRLAGQLALRKDGQALVAGGHPVPAFDAPLPHRSTHIIFSLDDGATLFLTDIRQFGFVLLLPQVASRSFLANLKLGPDAVSAEFTRDAFDRVLKRRPNALLKVLLLDQKAISGLGNIYADEALFRARLHPLRQAGSLSEEEMGRLFEAIGYVLRFAIDYGVAKVLNGRTKPEDAFPQAHGHRGDPCPRCGAIIERIRVTGRSSYYCATCQSVPLPS